MIHARLIRGSDLFFSICGIILLSPLLLAVALIIFITDGRPVLFVQPRLGLKGDPFCLYKFRSMTARDITKDEKAETQSINEFSVKIRNDPRITPIGHFVRRTSIDELPQLLNVLKGDMSLVGPRPWVPVEYDTFPKDWQAEVRLYTKPGITGLAQLNGRSDLPIVDIIALDRVWAQERTIILYFKVIFGTILKLLDVGKKQDGIY